MMSRELFETIVGELAMAAPGTTLMVDLQNEPLLNSDILSWFRYARNRAPRIHRVLTTNGALLHRFKVADVEAADLALLAVSLNAHTRTTYERINCGLDFDQVVSNILTLAEVAELRPRLRVDFVETELNVHELNAAREFWASRGIATYVKPLSNRSGVLKQYDSLINRRGPTARPVSPAIVKWLRRQLGCPHPFHQMSVLYNGDVILCCHDWQHRVVLGNLDTSSIKAVWNSKRLNNIRQSLVSGQARTIAPCSTCSLA